MIYEDQQGDQGGKNDLNEFIQRATPLIESLISENKEFRNFEAPKAKEKNSHEERAKLEIP